MPLVPIAIALTGMAAIVSQVLLMRELLVVFHGNELSIAFMLASWLIGGSTGSVLLSRIAGIRSDARPAFALSQAFLGFILPLSVLAVRLIRSAVAANPGEVVPPASMTFSCLLAVLPASSVLGLIFASGCRLYEGRFGRGGSTIGGVYILEAAGSVAGGVLAGFLLVKLFSPVQLMAGTGIALAACSAALLYVSGGSARRGVAFKVSCAALLACLGMQLTGTWARLDRYSASREWRGLDLIASRNSIYGNIAVARKASQVSFFDNGLHLYTVPDPQRVEESVHFAMLSHPDPRRVLLLGGGAGGMVEEVLRHPVEAVDYVELDPLIIGMAKDCLGPERYRPLEDVRVRLLYRDGRAYLKTVRGLYDVIIISFGDPYTAQINRFYTAEFFGEAKLALRPGGAVSFGLSSSESYIGKELSDLLGSIYLTAAGSFRHVSAIPGNTAYFTASDSAGSVTDDYGVMLARSSARRLDLRYVKESYLFARMSGANVVSFKRSLALSRAEPNRDFRPVSYYYDLIYWSARFKDSVLTKLLKRMDYRKVLAGSALAILLIALSGIRSLGSEARSRRAALLAITANGFSQLTLQVVILLAFQIIFGYMYYKIGVIIAAFMAGLAAGGYGAIRSVRSARRDLILALCALTVYAASLMPVLAIVSAHSAGAAGWAGSNIVFLLLPFSSGFIGGAIFASSGRVMSTGIGDIGRSGGMSYGMDLIGSCIGAMVAGTVFIPVLGIPATCLVVSAVDAAVLVVLVFGLNDPIADRLKFKIKNSKP